MTALAALLALVVAFPKPGARLPAISQTYVTGATSAGTKNVVVNGQLVTVHPRGGFVTMIKLHAGTNRVEIAASNGVSITNYMVFVASPPSENAAPTPPRKYEKLEYAASTPRFQRGGTIYLDAGHGGHDTGTLSPHLLKEKDANLAVAKMVAAELVKRGVNVKLTRSDDRAIELYERSRAAHADQNAAAFVSIHHNAPGMDRDPREVRYHAVYVWNELGLELAKAVNSAMASSYGTNLVNQGVIKANYAVTRSPQLPSCLVEVDFMTTPEEELDCWEPARRRRVATAIAEGIWKWTRELH